jgi:periplasmic protein TonB
MIRFISATLAGLLIVGLLFLGLDLAIGPGEKQDGPKAPARIEFTSLIRAKPVEAKKRFKPPPREKPKIDPSAMSVASTTAQSQANSPLKMDLSSSLLSGSGGVDSGSVTAGDVSAGSRFTGGRADRGLMPLVRVAPDYPQSASRQGLEGWVVVEFTVTSSGAVRDPQVLQAEPERIFDQAAMKSVLRWRYSPQVENGAPVEKQVRMKIVFELPENGRS